MVIVMEEQTRFGMDGGSAHSLRLMTVQLLCSLRRVGPNCHQARLPWLGLPDAHMVWRYMFISGTPDLQTG